jgi:hypothetical protein
MMDSTRAAAEAREILLNKEVIAVDQDSLGIQGTIVQASPSELQVWVKPLVDGSRTEKAIQRGALPPHLVRLLSCPTAQGTTTKADRRLPLPAPQERHGPDPPEELADPDA